MPSVREIVMNRAKEPAKVHNMDRVAAVPTPAAAPGSPPGSRGAQAPGTPHRGPGTPQHNGYGAARPPRPGGKPAPGGSPASVGSQPRRPSEDRRPRSTSLGPGPGNRRRAPSEPAKSRADEGDSDSATGSAGSRRGGPSAPRAKARASSVNRAPEKVRMGDAAPPVDRKDVGKVPAYLKKRQEEMAEAKKQAARPPSPQPPPGYRKVDETERQDTLNVLRQRKAEVEKAQRNLPFKIETLGQKQREKDLMDRSAQIDKLLGMFGKPVVFVPADAGPMTASVPPLGPDASSDAHAPLEGGAGSLISGGDGGLGNRRPVRTEVKVAAPPGGHSQFQLG